MPHTASHISCGTVFCLSLSREVTLTEKELDQEWSQLLLPRCKAEDEDNYFLSILFLLAGNTSKQRLSSLIYIMASALSLPLGLTAFQTQGKVVTLSLWVTDASCCHLKLLPLCEPQFPHHL